MKELVFGHKNPDTDAIVAAKAYAFYKTLWAMKSKLWLWGHQTKKQNLF